MKIKIFFDESGKKNNPPMTMGAISIPDNIYEQPKIRRLNDKLRDGMIKFHFTGYNGNHGEKLSILELFNELAPYLMFMRCNIIHYYKPNDIKPYFDKMVYEKLPERVFYGLLRDRGCLIQLEADIYMEEATEYREYCKKFKNELNIQSTYRGESYRIENCKLVPKGKEIGVEFTDLILGIIRIILEGKKESKSHKKKEDLVNEIISLQEVYDFLTSIRFFEWNSRDSVKEIRFKDYLDYYIAEHIADIKLKN